MSKLRDFALTLTAGVEQSPGIAGNFYHILEATDDVYISLDNGGYAKRMKGIGEKAEFIELRLKSLVTQNIRLVAGYGELIDTRDNVSVTVSATVTPSDVITPKTDVSLPAGGPATLICAANANRKSLMIKHNNGNDPADIVRLGSSSVAATSGLEIVAGETVTIETEAAVYGFNTGSAAVAVSIIENTITP
jgi:hypothetical protein